jgi:VCBS repeat-containing protein
LSGASPFAGNTKFRGAMDDISIFDRALSGGEVAALASTNTPPTIANKSIAENSPNGSVVFNANATDVDSGDLITYSIVSGNTNSTFAIDSATGQVSVHDVTKLNFEANGSYSIVVRATDTAGLFVEQTVNVIVTDVNEAPQDITLGTAPSGLTTAGNASLVSGTTYELTPNSTGQAGAVWGSVNLGQDWLLTTKVNFGANDLGGDGMTFTLQNDSSTALGGVAGGQGAGGIANAFGINFDNFYNVGAAGEVDSDFSQFFKQGNVWAQGTSFDAVNVHDNLEDANWHDLVVTWNATTKTLSYWLDGVVIDSINYDVVANDWGGNSNGWFGFTARTGAASNRQQVEILSIQVGGTTTVAEGAANGTVVGIAAAIDPDRVDSVTYSLLDSAGGRFAINSSSGAITVANSSLLNHEANNSHRVVVRAVDQGGLIYDKTLTIGVSNVNEAPVDVATSSQSITIENASFDAQLLADGGYTTSPPGWTVSGVAGDFNPSTAYFSSGNGTDGANVGYVDSVGASLSQVLSTNFSSTLNYHLTVDVGRRIDYSVPQSYTVELFAGATLLGSFTSVQGDNDAWGTAHVSVVGANFAAADGQSLRIVLNGGGAQVNFDNVRLTATSAAASIAENSASGTVVATASGLDRDPGDTLVYALTNNANGRFAINATTGAITVVDAARLNHEFNSVHTVTVRVTDGGGLNYSRTLTINVTDTAEAPQGILIESPTVLLSDDFGDGNVSDWTLSGGFALSGGKLVDPSNSIGFAIYNPPAAMSWTDVKVSADIELRDDDPSGVMLRYQDSNNFMLAQILSGNNANASQVALVRRANGVSTTLAVTNSPSFVQPAMDGQATGLYRLTLTAIGNTYRVEVNGHDAFGPIVDSILATGTIGLWNNYSQTTTFDNIRVTVSPLVVPENSSNGTVLGTAIGFDQDVGSTLTYSLTNSAGGRFAVDSSTGELSVANGTLLDFENAISHDITVRVTDQGGLTYDKLITISLSNVNDAPTISQVTGAVAAYDFENGSGNAPSTVAGGPNMTVGGSVTYDSSAGRVAGSEGLLFNTAGISSAASVTLPNLPSVASTGAITVASWVRYDAVDSWGRVFDFGVGGQANAFIVAREGTTNNLVVRYHNAGGGTIGEVEATNALTGALGSWMHVAASLDTSGNMSLHLNGALVGTTNVGAMANLPTWTSNLVGCSNWSGDALFRGAIDDFAIFDRVLLTGEVATLASITTQPTIVNKSLAENSADGTLVFNANASDADAGDSLTYSIVSGNTNSTFAIDSTTGQVTVSNSAALDFEVNPSYALVIRATDVGGLWVEETINVAVTNVNETPTATADAATALEAGGINNGTSGTNPTGNVLNNDTDIDSSDTQTVIGVAAGVQVSASGSVNTLVSGTYGSIIIAADGTYTYTVDNSNTDVQALRIASDTLQDVFTYTMQDSGGMTSTTQITATIQGANDAPSAISQLRNFLVNGSFENLGPHTTDAGTFRNVSRLPGWQYSGPSVVQVHETDGNNLNASDGGFWVDTVNDFGAGNELTLSQQVAGLTNGNNYQLSFDLGNRIGNDAFATGELNLGSVNVYWGGQLVATVSKSTYGWQSFSYSVQAAQAMETIHSSSNKLARINWRSVIRLTMFD